MVSDFELKWLKSARKALKNINTTFPGSSPLTSTDRLDTQTRSRASRLFFLFFSRISRLRTLTKQAWSQTRSGHFYSNKFTRGKAGIFFSVYLHNPLASRVYVLRGYPAYQTVVKTKPYYNYCLFM